MIIRICIRQNNRLDSEEKEEYMKSISNKRKLSMVMMRTDCIIKLKMVLQNIEIMVSRITYIHIHFRLMSVIKYLLLSLKNLSQIGTNFMMIVILHLNLPVREINGLLGW